jgi:hypothetical protein
MGEDYLSNLLPRVSEPDTQIDRLAHLVIGAAIEVHRQLGPGFLVRLRAGYVY